MAFKILSCGLLLAVSLFADSDPLAPLQFLAGDWIGDGGGADDATCQAVYVDGEGHVIHYTVENNDGTVRFVSTQYRLTYKKTGAATLSGTFGIAPPGKAGEYKQYLAWTARRK